MARACRMEDAVGKGYAEQRPHRRAIGFCAADRSGDLAIEFRLAGEQPADDAADFWRGGGARATERVLRQQRMQGRVEARERRQGRKGDHERADRAGAEEWHHGQFTVILLANMTPKFRLPPSAKFCSPRVWAVAAPSAGRWTLIWQAGGAPTRLAPSCPASL